MSADVFGPAQWIWNGDAATCNAYVDFRQTFEGGDGPWRLRICADSQYAVYVNGRLAGFGQYGDYPFWKVFDELDLGPWVRPGENTLLVQGYCQVTEGFTCRCGEPGVIYALWQGEGLALCSGPETLSRPNPGYASGDVDQISPQLRYSFVYDGVQAASTAGWAPSRAFPATAPFTARPIPKLRTLPRKPAQILSQGVYQECPEEGASLGQRMQYAFLGFRGFAQMTGLEPPMSLPQEQGLTLRAEGGQGLYVLLDLGEVDAGLLDLDLELNQDAEILIGWGEHTEDMRVRSYIGGRNFAAQLRAAAGRIRFVHPFKRMGARYVQLFIQAPEVRLYYAGMQPTEYPLSNVPEITLSDALHRRIYDISLRTLRACMHEHYEDCPWREQALYSMDSRNQMLFGYYAFGEYEFAKASLNLMALSLREDGMLEICSPANGSITIPCFSAIFAVQLQEYYLYSGDRAGTAALLPVARRILDTFLARLDDRGLIPAYRDPKYWNFYEWQQGLEGYHPLPQDNEALRWDAPLHCFVALALDRLAWTLRHLGDEPAAAHYQAACDALRQATHHTFFQPDRNLYASYANPSARWHEAELTQALAICAGVCPEPLLDPLLQRLASATLTPVTLSHSVFLYEALMRRPETYGPWVFRRIEHAYGAMLYEGATTFWETQDGPRAFGGAGSLCHGWSAAPVYAYFAYALGLRPTAPGYETYVVAPVPHPFQGIKAKIQLADGRLLVIGE